MKRVIKICIFGVLLILAGCRSEEDVLASHEIRERGSKKFATFISRDGKKVDYAEGFRYLALRYDSIHRKNHVGLNGGELETMGYKERKSVSHSYIEFSVRTELNIEENGDKWMMFPRVQSGQVVGLVAAALTDDGTYVSFIDIGRNNEVFRRYVGDFQEGIRGVENQTMGYIPFVWIIKRSKHPKNNPIDNRDSGGGRGGVWDIIRGIGSSIGIDEGGGVGSDGGGNGGGMDGPCAAFGDCHLDFSNLSDDFILDKSDAERYPKFSQTVKNIKNYVSANKKVKETLIKYTGLSEKELLNKLEYGKGPLVKVTELPDAYGYHNPFTNKVLINEKYVSQLEGAENSSAEVLNLFLSIVLLHEFVHWTDGLRFYYWQENGERWERETYGFVVDHNNVIKLIKK